MRRKPGLSVLILRLCEKIEKELGIVCDPTTFRRTYAGYWQRSVGAWSWSMRSVRSYREVGSQERASECVKRKYRLEISDDGTIDTVLRTM